MILGNLNLCSNLLTSVLTSCQQLHLSIFFIPPPPGRACPLTCSGGQRTCLTRESSPFWLRRSRRSMTEEQEKNIAVLRQNRIHFSHKKESLPADAGITTIRAGQYFVFLLQSIFKALASPMTHIKCLIYQGCITGTGILFHIF